MKSTALKGDGGKATSHCFPKGLLKVKRSTLNTQGFRQKRENGPEHL